MMTRAAPPKSALHGAGGTACHPGAAPLRLVSWNIHKGRNLLRRPVLSRLRRELRALAPDFVFLQEVRGVWRRRAAEAPPGPCAYLAEEKWPHVAYAPNVIRRTGHHGNAILSRLPFTAWENLDISAHHVEGRGILHAEIKLNDRRQPLHLLCLHLGLLERWRRRQVEQLASRIETVVAADAPIVVAGDFNDWRERITEMLAERLGLVEAFHTAFGRHARTWPSVLPGLPLDRVYVRNIEMTRAAVLAGPPWTGLSDHLPLLIEFR
jgi:endonuclease/exonuclease/phosphatase family metal-dependent hydrolase